MIYVWIHSLKSDSMSLSCLDSLNQN